MTEQLRVLYVDLDESADSVVETLAAEIPDAAVTTATSVANCLDRLDASVDCVVSEHDLPDGDALELLDLVRERRPGLPFLLFTATNAAPLVEELLSAAATDYVHRAGDASSLVLARRVEAAAADRRSSDSRAEEFRTVMESAADVVVTIDDESTVRYVNPAVEDVFGYEPDELVGESLTTLMSPGMAERHRDGVRRYLRTGERTLDWSVVELVGRHRDGSEIPLDISFGEFEHGGEHFFTGIVRDVTEQVELETQLREERNLTERIIDTSPIGILVADADGEFTLANRQAAEILGRSKAEIRGLGHDDPAWELTDTEGRPLSDDETPVRRIVEADEPIYGIDIGVTKPGGERALLSVSGAPLRGEDGEQTGVVLTLDDVTERRRIETELSEVFERIDDAFYAVDDRFRFTYVNERAEELLRHSEEELLGESVWERFPEATETVAWESFHRALENQKSTSYEFYFDPLGFWVEATVYPSETGLSVYFRDVTDRKEYERALEESERRYRTMAENFPNGAVALFDEDLRHTLIEGQIFDVLDANPEDLHGACVSEAFSPEDADGVVEKYRAALRGDSNSFDATVEDRRFRIWTLPVTDEDGNAFAGMAMGQDVTERTEREAKLERQRKQLAALNGLNETVRRTTDAIIEQSTREEIEATVCEHLAATDSYLLAWIGDVDVQTQTVNLRTAAGVESYLDDITVSVDPDDERSDGPTGRAVRTGAVQTTQDVRVDSRHEPWRDHSVEFGFRSSAAIPIVHEDAIFGVLNVYADRPNAFTGEERRVIGQLGEIVGHAIASVERKQALMADDVAEIEMRTRNVFEAIDLPVATDETITLDRMVPVEDQYLVYGTATEDGIEVLDAVVEQIPYWERVHVLDERFGERKFEARLSESPVLSAVAAHGGAVERAVIEGGDYRMTIQLPQGADVRRVIESVQATYPTAEVLARRQITRSSNPSQRVKRTWMDELTARQRTALETAYFAGFFEWPRDSSGEDVARSLDVSSPTFHQHLRAAERKLFEALFDELPATG